MGMWWGNTDLKIVALLVFSNSLYKFAYTRVREVYFEIKLWSFKTLANRCFTIKNGVKKTLFQIMKILNLGITGCSMHLPSMQYFEKKYATWKIADLWKYFFKSNQLLRMKSECWTLKELVSTTVRGLFFHTIE